METVEPLPLSRSEIRSANPTRRRRTSFSGKLLNFIAPKSKSPPPPPPPRPLISHPQPLHPRVAVCVRPKRCIRELDDATDENDPHHVLPRPRSRPRLLSNQSDASVHALRDPIVKSQSNLHVPPRHDSRPLKGVLKKSASENDAYPNPVSPTTDTTTHSGRFVTALTASASKPKNPTLAKRLRAKSWVPFSSRAKPPEESPQTRRAASTSSMVLPKPKKTVTFDGDSTFPLPGGTSQGDVSEVNHWEEIAMDLDGDGSPSGTRKFDCDGDPCYGTLTPRPGSPMLRRDHSITPIVPSQVPVSGSVPPNREYKATDKQMNKGTHRDVALRPFFAAPIPLPTPSSVFEIPPSRTIAGYIMDEALRDYAREKNRTLQPIPVTKRGPVGVMQRININIVPNQRHSTVWDANDVDTYAWGGTLVVRDSKAPSYFYPRHCIRDFKIDFAVLSSPTSHSSASVDSDPDAPPTYEWRTSHSGHFLSRSDVLTRLSSAHGIAVEPEYQFVPSEDTPDGPCAWLVHFWVPVPLHLLSREVCRTFVCRARVIVGDWETTRTDVPAGCVSATIESLRSEKLLGQENVVPGSQTGTRWSKSGSAEGPVRPAPSEKT